MGLVLLLAFVLLDGVDFPDVEDETVAELLWVELLAADEALVADDVAGAEVAFVVVDEAAESEEPLEQALKVTRPHAAIATTLRRRAWTWLVLIAPECPAIRPVSKSRDDRHAPWEGAPLLAMAGCASTQRSTCSATHSG